MIPNLTCEDIEFHLELEYPGLHPIDYQSISADSDGDLDKARAEAHRAHLVMLAHKQAKSVPEPVEDSEVWSS